MAKKEKSDYNQELSLLRESGPGRLYVLTGAEDYLREAFLDKLREKCLDGAEEGFNYRRMDGETLTMNALGEAIDAVPFFSDHTLVEVRGFDLNRCRDADAERLRAMLCDIPDYCTVAFVQPVDYELDGRLALVKTLKKQGRVIVFAEQDGAALVRWIARRFEHFGKSISRQDAEYLIFTSGALMNRLIPEIDKLSAGVEGDTVTRRDIDAMTQRLPEARVFDMTEQLGMGKFDEAARSLGEILATKEEPIMLLALIGLQMRRIYAAKLAAERHMSTADTMELTGVRFDFILRKLQQSARQFSLGQLRGIVVMCADYDYRLKSSGQDGRELLRELFAEMAARVKC